jgi:hypothetical protein
MTNLEITKISEVKEEEIKFLVEPQFPLGKLAICAGDGNVGKSNLMLAIAAGLKRGESLPWERDQRKREPANILFQSAEDGLADTMGRATFARSLRRSRIRRRGQIAPSAVSPTSTSAAANRNTGRSAASTSRRLRGA